MLRDFVRSTGIDALSVSIGNVHIMTHGKARIDVPLLEAIQRQVKISLVIHGGSGFPREAARNVIRRGVAKFNFGTVMKQAFFRKVGRKLAAYREPMNPHPFLGMGGRQDVLVAGREAVKKEVIELLRAFGSAGKARG